MNWGQHIPHKPFSSNCPWISIFAAIYLIRFRYCSISNWKPLFGIENLSLSFVMLIRWGLVWEEILLQVFTCGEDAFSILSVWQMIISEKNGLSCSSFPKLMSYLWLRKYSSPSRSTIKIHLVEAGGIEPPSERIQHKASTCLARVWNLALETPHGRDIS